jgi:proton-translocating NADH-quinone oxidoreductase chain M
MYELNGLAQIFFLPLLGSLNIFLLDNKHKPLMKFIAVFFAYISFLGFFKLFLNHFKSFNDYFHVSVNFCWSSVLNFNFNVSLDGISAFFVILTAFLIPLCIISHSNIVQNIKKFLISFLVLDFLLIMTFCVLDLLFFYIFFESVLIPMFLIIGVFGSRERKTLAAYYFFLYTLIGSISVLLSILYIYIYSGTTNYEILLVVPFSTSVEKFIWITFFLAFASKVPMIPMHLWLPEAHVEAPTSGSVILAGVLLKLGTYGFLRFSLPLFSKASCFFIPLIYTMGVIGIIFTSFTAIRQTDFKRIIAYTSIAHMNLVVLSIFSFNSIGLSGSILQSLSHGFVASALFLLIGIIYDRNKTRIVQYYGGLASVMPLYSFFFIFVTLSNISFPGTSSFAGEILILIGAFKTNTNLIFLAATSIVLGGAYSLWLLNRIVFGNLKLQSYKNTPDLSIEEIFMFVPLLSGILCMGVFPNFFLRYILSSVNYLIEITQF